MIEPKPNNYYSAQKVDYSNLYLNQCDNFRTILLLKNKVLPNTCCFEAIKLFHESFLFRDKIEIKTFRHIHQ